MIKPWIGAMFAGLFGTQIACAQTLHPGDVFQDCDICPEMVVLPAGRFEMGKDQAPIHLFKDVYLDTRPVREIAIDRLFAMGRYEVTYGEYQACVKAGACVHMPPMDEVGLAPRHPAHGVFGRDAPKYPAWSSQLTGQVYRLPSEAEWEYAARGGTSIVSFWWGVRRWPGKENCDGCRWPWQKATYRQVGSFAANPFGLYDMLGNVSEMTADCWHDGYDGAPVDASPRRQDNCPDLVSRGGSWRSPWPFMTVWSRQKYHRDKWLPLNGLRVVRELTDEELGGGLMRLVPK